MAAGTRKTGNQNNWKEGLDKKSKNCGKWSLYFTFPRGDIKGDVLPLESDRFNQGLGGLNYCRKRRRETSPRGVMVSEEGGEKGG